MMLIRGTNDLVSREMMLVVLLGRMTGKKEGSEEEMVMIDF